MTPAEAYIAEKHLQQDGEEEYLDHLKQKDTEKNKLSEEEQTDKRRMSGNLEKST